MKRMKRMKRMKKGELDLALGNLPLGLANIVNTS